MSSSKTKRWHGNVEAIKPEFLNGVIGQMAAYGDRVHFSMFGSVQKPHYEVINSFDKKMAFDGNHHLHRAEDDEFGAGNVTPIFTLEQIKRIIATGGSGVRSSTPRSARAASARSAGGARPMTAAARAREAIDGEKYAYFKANREMLPEGINQYSDDISALMLKGMSAEQAFGEIIEKHFG
ncbi:MULTISPECIES: hypothetical protein [unclassified Herbaspirillum]|uniref:hypothetical protein n=1 Tax=unclassified Herbaspirillum TaxID=2624150 RepID=UPI001154D2B6|nr:MULTISPECIES: hypothetical protein [unclassified Herbaspirillum]MBB5391571.1 hypothetical protein [Herbaspirillum sp. SJZ102]TQK12747.1 hypothetical protein FB599_0153 [Herbaspirillum sp. SJZ130]TQK14751.1 hypothetical protein FB598_0091 [Herbaspirillum sp. SJZ106]TWC62837.1 hypothetical protein FB597_11291 [Herbaspirillum sp. SJZ099]